MRAAYADVGARVREAQTRAVECGTLVGRDWRVLLAVIALVASWSRTEDTLTAQQIADAAGMDVRNTQRVLARLVERGIIIREPSAGRRPSITGLPEPRPQTATVEDDEHRPHTTTVETNEPRPHTATDDPPQPWSPAAPNTGRTRPDTREESREESSATPAGQAGGLPSSHQLHAERPPVVLEQQPALWIDECANPAIRNLMARVPAILERSRDAEALEHIVAKAS